MPIDPNAVQWDAPAPQGIQWDDAQKAPAGVKPLTRTDRFMRGLLDPLDGAAQLLYNMLPAGVQKAGDAANNWLADNTGLLAKLPQGGVDQLVRDENAAYEAKRKAAGEEGIDGWRITGNIINPANLAVAARLPQAASLAGRVGSSALGGGMSALFQPVTQGDSFAQEKVKQVALGAGFGGAAPVVFGSLGRMISPKASVDPALSMLRSEGVRPTIGQTLGGAANRLEEKAVSLPFVGDGIAAARRRAAGDLNDAVANRALAPIGQTLPKGLQGREAVAHVQRTLSDAYEAILPRMSVRADPAFGQEISSLRQMVKTGSIDPKAGRLFDRILQNDVMGKFRGQQALTGQTLKGMESDIGAQISRLQQSTDADSRLVADALKEVQSSLRGVSARSNPQLANELGRINQGWANFKRLERAASYVGAEDGIFSPANLQSAVKALDKSKDKGRFARGDSLMQDLSDAAKSRLGDKVPNSGTADRLMSGGVLGAGFLDPMIPGSFLAGAAAYSPPVQALLRGLVTARPQGAQAVRGLLNQTSPMLAPASGLLALGALDQ